MKELKYLLVIFVALIHYSCSTEPENDYIDFKIKVDKLTYPDTVYVNDSLQYYLMALWDLTDVIDSHTLKKMRK